ncbi:hypothetical protein PR202_ga00291 [Eleusine coracana subsp. coracana]|uniref:MATH domain-containing protein n=1 Tax=Eleusine coracana subsp. coracana TaxID=191504 RepID=A0AAV5BDX1_ELECO|nr:hypothetical protein PR202_ga00291 [Eleusine coracana subsp. coracana]
MLLLRLPLTRVDADTMEGDGTTPRLELREKRLEGGKPGLSRQSHGSASILSRRKRGVHTTRSAMVAGNVTGHHLLDIEGYSVTKELLPCGKCMDSHRFKFGGRLWYISYYPNGRNPVYADFISIYLKLVEGIIDKPMKAVVTYNLLDQAGKPVPSHILTTGVCEYSTQGFGFQRFIKREFLENSDHIKNDCFTIRCDITIKKLQAEERTALPPSVDVPPSDLHQHLGNLLVTKEGADVTF